MKLRTTTLIMAVALTALLAGTSAAGVKYVAVVETDVDAQSGASAILNPAEVRQVTAELRRVAVENLSRDKYNIMTSETVQSMGGAVLEECADENCVITLGSKIGADYIVRGIISKLGARLTLSVEMYETENGTLVASLDPVRSENVELLVERMAGACGEMYRKFAGTPTPSLSAPTAQIKTEVGAESNVAVRKPKAVKIKKRRFDYYVAPKYQLPAGTPVWWGGVNLEAGMTWWKGMFVGIDFGGGWSNPDDHATYFVKTGGGSGFILDRSSLYELGISFGNVYDLGNKLQLVYGGSVGNWLVHWGEPCGYKSYHDAVYYAQNNFALFIKLRKNFVELTYRGLLGYKDVGYDFVKGGGSSPNGKSGIGYESRGYSSDVFNYNHQLMLGFYFATSKRSRPE